MTERPLPPVSETTVRDHLALERTRLANERTLLAYIRTMLALVGAGAALLHFFEGVWVSAAGWTLVAGGFAALVIGMRRFTAVARRLGS